MQAQLRDQIAALPEEPRVYLMKDGAGVALYAGKAKNLNKRGRSCSERGRDERAMTPFLEARWPGSRQGVADLGGFLAKRGGCLQTRKARLIFRSHRFNNIFPGGGHERI